MKLAAILAACAMVALIAATTIALNPAPLRAQDAGGGDQGMSMNPSMPSNDTSMPADDPSMAPPMSRMHITQEITGSMLVAPPYGLAPLKVGFFVIADDPEGQGFLTYSWNFGDGTVSALPPELYIFHNYQNPGNYVCTLTVKTVDGRSQTFIQGVLVKTPGD
jgi:PKD domain